MKIYLLCMVNYHPKTTNPYKKYTFLLFWTLYVVMNVSLRDLVVFII